MDLSSTLIGLFAHANSVGMQGIIQFIFSNNENIWVNIDSITTAASGLNPDADTQIEITTENFLHILAGSADIEQLFASGDIKISGDLGLATLLPQIIDRAVDGDTETAPAPVNMNGRYPAQARISEHISARQTPLLTVERRSRQSLTTDEFRKSYLSAGIPLIVTNALNDWPLFTMSRADSLAHFADLTGITRHGDYVSNTFSTKRDFRTVAISDFIAALDDEINPAGVPSAYMGNNIVPTQLLDKIRLPPYFDSSLFNPPRIWIGPKGTLTPLHRDDSDNLFAQVWGKKSFILAAPHHREAVGAWSTSPQGGLDGCDFNPDAPDYGKHPAAKNVAFVRLILEAGDMLFLPEGWFHQVESISTSLSVNFWINSGRGW